MYFALETACNRLSLRRCAYENDMDLFLQLKPYLGAGLILVYGSGCSIGIHTEEELIFSCSMVSRYYNAEKAYDEVCGDAKDDTWNYSLFTPVPESLDMMPVDSDQSFRYLQDRMGLNDSEL